MCSSDLLGGKSNIAHVSACTTRLRIEVHNDEQVDEKGIRALDIVTIIQPRQKQWHIVLGMLADNLAEEIKRQLNLEEDSYV